MLFSYIPKNRIGADQIKEHYMINFKTMLGLSNKPYFYETVRKNFVKQINLHQRIQCFIYQNKSFTNFSNQNLIIFKNRKFNKSNNNKSYYNIKLGCGIICSFILTSNEERKKQINDFLDNFFIHECLEIKDILKDKSKSKEEKIGSIKEYAEKGGPMNSFPQGDFLYSFLQVVLEGAIYDKDPNALIDEAFKQGTIVHYEGFNHGSPIADVANFGLFESLTEKKIEIIKFLIKHGYDINYKSENYNTVIFQLITHEHLIYDDLLIKEMHKLGAKLNKEESPIHYILRNMCLGRVNLPRFAAAMKSINLIGGDFNQVDEIGQSALFFAFRDALHDLQKKAKFNLSSSGLYGEFAKELQKYNARLSKNEKEELLDSLNKEINVQQYNFDNASVLMNQEIEAMKNFVNCGKMPKTENENPCFKWVDHRTKKNHYNEVANQYKNVIHDLNKLREQITKSPERSN